MNHNTKFNILCQQTIKIIPINRIEKAFSKQKKIKKSVDYLKIISKVCLTKLKDNMQNIIK